MLRYYTALIVFSVLTMLILMVLTVQNDALSVRLKRGFALSSLMIVAASCCEYLGVIMNGGAAELRWAHLLVKCCELSITPAIPIVFANAVEPVKYVRRLIIPLAAHALIEVSSMWLGLTFYVDAANVYYHCDFYGIYYAAYFLGIVFLLMQVSRSIRHFQIRNKLSLWAIMAFMVVGILWQAVDSSMKVVWLTIAIADVLFYTFYCDILQQTDTLTRLLNRRSYDNRMAAQRRTCVVLFADIDNFKNVNDTLGHRFGDVCLSAVADAMKEAYGRNGMCYRIGGDEFCVIIDGPEALVDQCGARFTSLLDKRRETTPDLPTVSSGYSLFRPESMTPIEAAEIADRMMYEAKQRSKGSEI